MSPLLKNTRILIVDDNADSSELLRVTLERAGAAVSVAQSVDDAIKAFRRRPAHVVVTDIRLGRSDGYELLRSIRKCNSEYRGFTPVIALTGYASTEDEKRAKGVGFYAYLRKPCDPQQIVRTISKALWSTIDLAA